jgi:hypothetical protein
MYSIYAGYAMVIRRLADDETMLYAYLHNTHARLSTRDFRQ